MDTYVHTEYKQMYNFIYRLNNMHNIDYFCVLLLQIEWSPVPPHQDMVYSLSNGSLVFHPFSAEKYRHEFHSAVYR